VSGQISCGCRWAEIQAVDAALETTVIRCFLLLGVLVVGCARTASPEVPGLRFTAIPDQNTTLLKTKFDPIAAHLSEVLGVPVQYVPAMDYSASVEMFRNGDIQLAWFGGLTGVQARAAVHGARAIAQGAEDPQYKSYFIAHTSTGLEWSAEFPSAIKDLSFTFGSEASTSGRLMPEFFIREHSGGDLASFFSTQPGFSGAHDKTAKLVESGAVDAGVLSYKTFDSLVESGKIDPAKAKIIWETPPYADYNFTAHPSLEATYGAGFTDKLQGALIGMTRPDLLQAFPRSAIIKAQNTDFERIETIAKNLKMMR
jgi:phosphonate transport system substrate-binding protein